MTTQLNTRWRLSLVHTSNNVEATFYFVEATFDFVAKTATMSNEFIAKFRPYDKVETNWTCSICFDIVERTKFRSTCSIRQCCFDIVAGVDGALVFDWMFAIWRSLTVKVCVYCYGLRSQWADRYKLMYLLNCAWTDVYYRRSHDRHMPPVAVTRRDQSW